MLWIRLIPLCAMVIDERMQLGEVSVARWGLIEGVARGVLREKQQQQQRAVVDAKKLCIYGKGNGD